MQVRIEDSRDAGIFARVLESLFQRRIDGLQVEQKCRVSMQRQAAFEQELHDAGTFGSGVQRACFAAQPFVESFSHKSSTVLGQLALSNFESARSANKRPPVWQRAQ